MATLITLIVALIAELLVFLGVVEMPPAVRDALIVFLTWIIGIITGEPVKKAARALFLGE